MIDNPNVTFTTSIVDILTDDFGNPEAVELTLTFDLDQLREGGISALYDPMFDIVTDLKTELSDMNVDLS